MIRLSSIKLKPDHAPEELKNAAAKAAGIRAEDIVSLKILRRSVEARKKEPLALVYTVLAAVRDEDAVRAFFRTKKGKDYEKKHSASFLKKERSYLFPYKAQKTNKRPLIIGSGPAGLLCAYELAKAGFAPIVAERGLPVAERTKKAELFFKTGKLDPECNIQFGEGGAGTFSDGKLNTGVTDKFCRAEEVLQLFVRCGAPEDILYDAKPHVGSDRLAGMVQNLREEIISLGGTFFFDKRAVDIIEENGRLRYVLFSDGDRIEADAAVFAIGHSARDTFRMLYERGVLMTPKAFAVGVRCVHDQEMINVSQWGKDYPRVLGAAPYKLTHRAENGRSVYTFCMCPGGYVINASSEKGGLCVNGMSERKRDSGAANSAVIVSVTPQDYLGLAHEEVPEALTGMEYQRILERKAFEQGNGRIPAQRYADFVKGRRTENIETACVKGGTAPADLRKVLPEEICEALTDGFEAFDTIIPGFKDTILFGVESRTSSPVRIERDERFQSNIKGLFPCGEGAGYAGGILSAAIDGIKTAEAAAFALNEGV